MTTITLEGEARDVFQEAKAVIDDEVEAEVVVGAASPIEVDPQIVELHLKNDEVDPQIVDIQLKNDEVVRLLAEAYLGRHDYDGR